MGLKNPRGWFDSNSDRQKPPSKVQSPKSAMCKQTWTLDISTLDSFARVAQLTERWSYKPEVEGLSPSLGTKKTVGSRQEQEAGVRVLPATCFLLLHPDLSGRGSSRQNGDCQGAWSLQRPTINASRPDHILVQSPKSNVQSQRLSWLSGRWTLDSRLWTGFLGPVAQRNQSVCLLNRRSQVRILPGSPFQCGVAQAGKSVRLINERLRVRIPPPRPITSPKVQCPKSKVVKITETLDLGLETLD